VAYILSSLKSPNVSGQMIMKLHKSKEFKLLMIGFCFGGITGNLIAQQVPLVHKQIFSVDNRVGFIDKDTQFWAIEDRPAPGISNVLQMPEGNANGLTFDFKLPDFKGTLYYGLINNRDGAFHLPVYFKRSTVISAGKSEINLAQLSGKYDMSGWKEFGEGLLGYRIADHRGKLLYDGRVSFGWDKANYKFILLPTLIEGPMLSAVSHDSIIVRCVFQQETPAALWVSGREIKSPSARIHEFVIKDLTPNTTYRYCIYPGLADTFNFTTAPMPGSRQPFTLAYASDSRSGMGGGERDLGGVNAYIMKKLFALALHRKAALFQFTGDLIDGYLTDENKTRLQYANWKRAIEPFTRFMPLMATMGNHEALVYRFKINENEELGIDRFPFERHSAEAVFADEFAMPVSNLISEDGAFYDPSDNSRDFPPYRETVFSYRYGNAAVIVLNSNYWYAYLAHAYPQTDGNIHAYIMDNQLNWLKKEMERLESDTSVDHILLTLHTPFFPNGGHVDDDMWYGGSNLPRPYVAGKPVKKGIIERRDEMLEILVNQSSKFRAFLTGDEHNYARTLIGPDTEIYPANYTGKKINLRRKVWQINNGSAGAPYYGQEQTPWSAQVRIFSTQYALVLLHFKGSEIKAEILNPDTMEEIEQFEVTF
jgi:hypothetical protein